MILSKVYRTAVSVWLPLSLANTCHLSLRLARWLVTFHVRHCTTNMPVRQLARQCCNRHHVRYGLVVRISGFHPGGSGSIPGTGMFLTCQDDLSLSVCAVDLRVSAQGVRGRCEQVPTSKVRRCGVDVSTCALARTWSAWAWACWLVGWHVGMLAVVRERLQNTETHKHRWFSIKKALFKQ